MTAPCTNWQTAAQMFSSLFEKPKMSEKLLSKPPFKYIFDIITETTKATDFAKGLYNEDETNAQFYESKEKKIIYLKKMIDLVQIMLKEEIPAKPNKIVAGLEPDNTNIFLQAIYRAAVSLENSQPFVKKILTKYANEEGGGGEQEEQDTPQQPQAPKKEEKPEKKKQEEKKEEAPQKKQEKVVEEKKDDKNKQTKKPSKKEEPPQQEEEDEPPKKVAEKTKKPTNAKKQEEDEDRQIQQLQQQQQELKKQQEQQNQQQQKMKRPDSSKRPPAIKSNVKVEESVKGGKGTTGVIMDGGEIEEDQQQIENASTQQQRKGDIDTANRGKFIQDAMKEEGIEQQKPQNEGQQEEEDEQGGPKIKMGRLGKKKTKKEKDTGASNQGATGGQGQNFSNISPTTDVETLNKLVQQICQNANPLGKSLEFIQDDIESMNHELDYWQKQYKASKDKMQNELKITEENLQPFQDKLSEIQQQIQDQKSKISNMKGQILKNQSTIQSLLYSVVASK